MALNTLLISVFKRVISNVIDIALFLGGYIILNLVTGIENNIELSYYLLFVTYILLFALPIILLGNTLAKTALNLKWKNQNKSLLLLKYSLYFLAFFPGFSIVSLLTKFPYLKISNYDFAISIQLLITIITLDVLLFLLSLGKYHLLDYLLNLQLINLEFKKKLLKSLSIYLLFWSILIFINLVFLKYDLSIKKVNNSVSQDVYFENYPTDLFYGEKPFIVKKKSNDVFITSDMFSFLFNKPYEQKIIFLKLPQEIFNSKKNRYNTCVDLLVESNRHNIFLGYKPKQTKIVLRTFKEGHFLEYYSYSYTYYYNNEDPSWGIYGGIKNDSTMIDKYFSFIKKTKEQNTENIKIQSSLSANTFALRSKNSEIQFDKISFEDSELHGNMQLNFPPQKIMYRTNYLNIIGGEISEIEDDLFYIKTARNEISAKSL